MGNNPHLCLDWKTDTVKISILPLLIYRLKAISTKILAPFYVGWFIWKNKGSKIDNLDSHFRKQWQCLNKSTKFPLNPEIPLEVDTQENWKDTIIELLTRAEKQKALQRSMSRWVDKLCDRSMKRNITQQYKGVKDSWVLWHGWSLRQHS
jgi:hypothetical protein